MDNSKDTPSPEVPRMPYTESVLSAEADALVRQIIGCAIAVHRALGPGFMESIYSNALAMELEPNRIPFERERPVFVSYRGREIGGQRVDFIVAGTVILEIKAVTRLDPVLQAKLISYLKTTGLRVGPLLNFNTLADEGRRQAACDLSSSRASRDSSCQ